jgi:hypothetical protein
MLVRNYRSHSTLLQIPNLLFYDNFLIAAAEQAALLPPQWDSLRPSDGADPGDSGPGGAAAEPGEPPDGEQLHSTCAPMLFA